MDDYSSIFATIRKIDGFPMMSANVPATNGRRSQTAHERIIALRASLTNSTKKVTKEQVPVIPINNNNNNNDDNNVKKGKRKMSPTKEVEKSNASPKKKQAIIETRSSKSRQPIAERIQKIREKLSQPTNKTDTNSSRETDCNKEIPSKSESPKSRKINFKIPKIQTPLVNGTNDTDNVNTEAMDIESLAENNSVESMDWEINVVRRELQDPAFKPSTEIGCDSFKTVTDGGQWILVIDTNVFIADLKFVQAIRDTDVTGLGFPVIYVPHRVLSELDALKDKLNLKNPTVAQNARRAVTYINQCLINKHPRLKGQSVTMYLSIKDMVNEDSDDKILLSCLQIKKAQPEKQTIFLSNDTNLRNKAILEDIDTFSVDGFQKTYMGNLDEAPEKMDKARLQFKIKTICKIVLSEIFETETKMKVKTTNLEDLLCIFTNNWQEFFENSVPLPAEEQLQKMRNLLDTDEIEILMTPMIDAAKSFLTFFYIKNKRYFNLVQKTITLLGNLKKRALDFEQEPSDEKYFSGALEEILKICWEKIYAESTSIHAAKQIGDALIEEREKNFIVYLKQLIDLFEKVALTNIFDITTSTCVAELAAILAACCNDEEQRVKNILIHVCTTIDGRKNVANAFQIFKKAFENCNTMNQF